ncbi:Uncharacterised protein [Bordetella pertussis]|nr:Uncharacterised protein [Bordetella pertussis]
MTGKVMSSRRNVYESIESPSSENGPSARPLSARTGHAGPQRPAAHSR